MRSNEACVLKVPKFKHDTFGMLAFAVGGPLAWNCLPKEISWCDEIEAFKWTLKTHSFLRWICKWVYSYSSIWRIIVMRPTILSLSLSFQSVVCHVGPMNFASWDVVPERGFPWGYTYRCPIFELWWLGLSNGVSGSHTAMALGRRAHITFIDVSSCICLWY